VTIYVSDGNGGVKEVRAEPVLVGDGAGGLRLTRESAVTPSHKVDMTSGHLDEVTLAGDTTENHPFPPPAITRWLQRRSTSTDALVQELDYWAHRMAGGTDESYVAHFTSNERQG
jgi:hypothetical protein